MSFEIEGVLHKKYEIESKTASFQAREFVLLTEGTYPQYVKFQLTQDKCSLIDPLSEGEKIKVAFDLRGREWQGKYFTNLNAWKVEKSATASNELNNVDTSSFPPPMYQPPSFETQQDNDGSPANNFEDLPF